MCVCVCVQLGMYASPRYVTIPTPPTHPPPTQPKGMCVQMSPQKHVVCTDESDLCEAFGVCVQMSQICVRR